MKITFSLFALRVSLLHNCDIGSDGEVSSGLTDNREVKQWDKNKHKHTRTNTVR